MNSTDRTTKAAAALGCKTARACESCLVKRARWFCSADDVFLCQACDSSVHSANLLASKHERFRLETSSCKIDDSSPSLSWHKGFTKKARTPRQPKLSGSIRSQLQTAIDPLVPEINCEEYPFHPYDENDEQSAGRVPVFDPNFDDEYFRVGLGGEGICTTAGEDDDLDIEELFASCDVDSFFGVSNNKDLGLRIRTNFDSEEDVIAGDDGCNEHLVQDKSEVKAEEDEESDQVHACHFDPMVDMELDWDFDCNNDSMAGGEMKTEAVLYEATKNTFHDTTIANDGRDHQPQEYDKRTMLLRLDYEEVITAWASRDSPWVDGVRPRQFNMDEFMAACLRKLGLLRNDAEREARVSRYREKRRTRLFSKKIRYQVRKLNAEKRPRVKGRFVKRTATISYPYSFMNNR